MGYSLRALINQPEESNQYTGDANLVFEDGIPATAVVHAAVVTGSAIGTVGKTTTAALPATGTIVPVKFTNGNTASSATLAFATGGAKSILLGGTASTGAKLTVAAQGVVLFWFDGTALHQLGVVS